MGAWGIAITSDDTVMDIITTYKETLKKSQSYVEARSEVEKNFSAVANDEESHLYWLALANIQWKYGVLDNDVLFNVTKIVNNGDSLKSWEEQGDKVANKRKKVLNDFCKKISTENHRPLKKPKFIKQKQLFQVGDCLSIQQCNETYIAGLVKRVDLDDIEYPSYLIFILDWKGNLPPKKSDFLGNQVLIVTEEYSKKKIMASAWYGNYGYRENKQKIVVVCNLPDRANDSCESNLYTSLWSLIDYNFVRTDKDA